MQCSAKYKPSLPEVFNPIITGSSFMAGRSSFTVNLSEYGEPDNVLLAAHPEGHVVDVPSLMEFFGETLK